MLRRSFGRLVRGYLGSVSPLTGSFHLTRAEKSPRRIRSYLKLLRLSTSLTSSISQPAFIRRLAESLEKQSKAVIKLNLLRITRAVCDNHPDRALLVSRFSLSEIVDKLSKQDEAILVRELAKEVYPSLLFGSDTGADVLASRVDGAMAGGSEGLAVGGNGNGNQRGGDSGLGMGGKRVPSVRRTASEIIVADNTLGKKAKKPTDRQDSSKPLNINEDDVKAPLIPVSTMGSTGGHTSDKTRHKRKVSRNQLR